MALSSRFDMWLYPELKWFEDKAARKEACSRCGLKSTWLLTLINWTIAALTLGWLMLVRWFAPLLLQRGMHPLVGTTLASMVFLVLVAFQHVSMLAYFRRKVRPRLRELLAERGIVLCHSCGCNLTGITDGTCPECGAAF